MSRLIVSRDMIKLNDKKKSIERKRERDIKREDNKYSESALINMRT